MKALQYWLDQINALSLILLCALIYVSFRWGLVEATICG